MPIIRWRLISQCMVVDSHFSEPAIKFQLGDKFANIPCELFNFEHVYKELSFCCKSHKRKCVNEARRRESVRSTARKENAIQIGARTAAGACRAVKVSTQTMRNTQNALPAASRNTSPRSPPSSDSEAADCHQPA